MSPQLFTAPLELAKICADELRFDEAEELAAGVRARATAIAQEHPEADYAFSYAVAACLMQAELLFNKDAGENVEATAEKVRRLADDFRREFPPAPYAGEEGLSREQARKLRGARLQLQDFEMGIEFMIDLRTHLKDSAAGQIIRKRDEERRRKLEK